MWVVTEKSIGTFCGIFFNRYTFWRKLKPCLITWTVMFLYRACSNPKLASTTLLLIEVWTGLISLYLAHFLYCITTVDGFLCKFPRSIFFSRASCLASFSFNFWSNLHHSFSIAGGKFPQKYVLKGVEKCAQVWKAKFGVDLKSNINSDGEVGRGASLFIN